jgi:hypothetical protein
MTHVLVSLLLVALAVGAARADVVTTLTGTKLVVTGDANADSLAIEPEGDGIAVVGLDGTLVNGSSERLTVPGVQRLVVQLKEGADRLTITDVALDEGIDVRLGRGNDSVVVDRVDMGRSRIRTDNGWDAVWVYGSRLNRLSVETSTGYDLVVLEGLWVPGDLAVDTGPDEDEVEVFATEVGDDVDIDLSNDDDFLLLADVVVYDDTDLDGDDGDDYLALEYVWFDDDVDIDGFGDGWWWW